jgi:hypothetical protein
MGARLQTCSQTVEIQNSPYLRAQSMESMPRNVCKRDSIACVDFTDARTEGVEQFCCGNKVAFARGLLWAIVFQTVMVIAIAIGWKIQSLLH